MSLNRAKLVDQAFLKAVAALSPSEPAVDLDAPIRRGSGLTGRVALALFEAQAQSRLLDIAARELRARNEGFYTIGSSGHEGNVVLGDLLRPTDLGFLHYRSGALYARRLGKVPGQTPLFDTLLSLAAAADDPTAGGRHKVWGSKALNLPPQTSTIASHLPKAVGAAFGIERAHRLGLASAYPADAIAFCTFGDASLNHSTAQGAINTALWSAYQKLPVPILFVCEDNGIGISVKTPTGWVGASMKGRPGLGYFFGDGLDLPDAHDAARRAISHCRTHRQPTFLHLRTVRLLGHAGSDIETEYRTPAEIEATEALDPLIATARLLVDAGVAQPDELLSIYDELRERITAAAREAGKRPRLTSAAQVNAPLAPFTPDAVRAEATRSDYADARRAVFGDALPEVAPRPRWLSAQINAGLMDLMAKYPESILFGEDVAKKGGVYHVTAGLHGKFGPRRVFNSILDEQSILGTALGAAHVGLLPIPEIQYLAYLHNAEDQLRGEACSLQYFSNGEWRNPMLVRIAGLAYQKGFGGHFHNDNSFAALRDMPGLVLCAPARGDDAVGMLRTAMALCKIDGRVVVFLEPIALYGIKDLHTEGDGGWLSPFPAPGEAVPFGEGRVYNEDAADLTILTFGNGVYLSLRAAKKLADETGIRARVVDLRWLNPLNESFIRDQSLATGRVLIVDEGRRTGGLSEAIFTVLAEGGLGYLPTARVVGDDTFIPLGDAWTHVLPSEQTILDAAKSLVGAARHHDLPLLA